MFCFGNFPDNFYRKIRQIPFTIAVTNLENEDHEVEDPVPYHSNAIIIEIRDFSQFEDILRKAKDTPFWHPHSNVIIYYQEVNRLSVAKVFYILWYYRVCNAIITQYDKEMDMFLISYYNPHVTEKYQLDYAYGCWKAKKIGMPVQDFHTGFVCVEECKNVTLESSLRADNLGTCIGIKSYRIRYSDIATLRALNLFEDKGKNLHGYTLRAFTTEVLPFLTITENADGTYTLGARDGMIWNTLSKLMNFSIDLSPSLKVMKLPFKVELNIQQVFSLAHRKADLFLIPIYQFDMVVIEVDYTFPIRDSGVCFVSHRAGFENILFDTKLLYSKCTLVIQFFVCMLCVWLLFVIFNVVEMGGTTLDQIGKDLLNTVRNVLSINLHKPPNQRSFRIFMGVSLWSFFILNFFSQASITSFFTAVKRGKEVETFDDVIEKGYPIEGMASPDVLLPTEDARFRKLSEKIVPIQDTFTCIKKMRNDSKLFCLMDCSVGRYVETNFLNDKGEQYMHIATDRIHSYYLNIIYPKYSVLSTHTNKFMMKFIEAGLIKKWEQYKFKNLKTESAIKPLGIDDFKGIFNMYCLCLVCILGVFLLEVFLGNAKRIKSTCLLKYKKWNKIGTCCSKANEI
ncbi:uncharacterized protein LOC115439873 [Manduca sexta]|uniref:uncharacterized protein LOC115439873 n=1 Tax=Manduca sexta TaxID=7130 RepID=UPI00118422B2|nr:uncharacterized protein LOC115439873 [Manduca sexta]